MKWYLREEHKWITVNSSPPCAIIYICICIYIYIYIYASWYMHDWTGSSLLEIALDNGMFPVWCQAIILANDDLSSTTSQGTGLKSKKKHWNKPNFIYKIALKLKVVFCNFDKILSTGNELTLASEIHIRNLDMIITEPAEMICYPVLGLCDF